MKISVELPQKQIDATTNAYIKKLERKNKDLMETMLFLASLAQQMADRAEVAGKEK